MNKTMKIIITNIIIVTSITIILLLTIFLTKYYLRNINQETIHFTKDNLKVEKVFTNKSEKNLVPYDVSENSFDKNNNIKFIKVRYRLYFPADSDGKYNLRVKAKINDGGITEIRKNIIFAKKQVFNEKDLKNENNPKGVFQFEQVDKIFYWFDYLNKPIKYSDKIKKELNYEFFIQLKTPNDIAAVQGAKFSIKFEFELIN